MSHIWLSFFDISVIVCFSYSWTVLLRQIWTGFILMLLLHSFQCRKSELTSWIHFVKIKAVITDTSSSLSCQTATTETINSRMLFMYCRYKLFLFMICAPIILLIHPLVRKWPTQFRVVKIMSPIWFNLIYQLKQRKAETEQKLFNLWTEYLKKVRDYFCVD